MVGVTLIFRRRWSTSDSLVALRALGKNQYKALDIRGAPGDATVVAMWAGAPVPERPHVIAPDFGSFFLATVREVMARGWSDGEGSA